MKTFFGVPSEKVLHVFFCKPWAPLFEVKQRLAPFLPGCSGLLTRFFKSKLLGMRLQPMHPSFNTTAFHNGIIDSFIVY